MTKNSIILKILRSRTIFPWLFGPNKQPVMNMIFIIKKIRIERST